MVFVYVIKHSNWYLALLFSHFLRCLQAAGFVKNFSVIKLNIKLWFVNERSQHISNFNTIHGQKQNVNFWMLMHKFTHGFI